MMKKGKRTGYEKLNSILKKLQKEVKDLKKERQKKKQNKTD